jgi:hypothetical protein
MVQGVLFEKQLLGESLRIYFLKKYVVDGEDR